MKEWLLRWLLGDHLGKYDRALDVLAREVAELKKAPVVIAPTQPLKAEHVMRPFRVNRIPLKQQRALLEWKNSPEYKAQQEEIRSRKAMQPEGKQ